MPVGSTIKTRWEECAGVVYILDPDTGEPSLAFELTGNVSLEPTDASPADYHAPADNTAAVVAYAGVAGSRHVVSGVSWSYDDDPTGGQLLMAVNGVTVKGWDITTGGPGFIPFPTPEYGSVGGSLSFTLAAGGADIAGKVSVLGHRVV